MNYFKDLHDLDVKKEGWTDKKGNYDYLKWCFAWGLMKQYDPTASYEIVTWEGAPWLQTPAGQTVVSTIVTCKGQSHQTYLAVTDVHNNPIRSPKVTDILNTIQRCFTKSIAMHGLGLDMWGAIPTLPPDVEKGPDSKTMEVFAKKFCDVMHDADSLDALLALKSELLDAVSYAPEFGEMMTNHWNAVRRQWNDAGLLYEEYRKQIAKASNQKELETIGEGMTEYVDDHPIVKPHLRKCYADKLRSLKNA